MTVLAFPSAEAAAAARAVPRFPRLRGGTPVAWRGDAVQVGFSLVLPGAPAGAVAALRLLDGRRAPAAIATAGGVDPAWLAAVLDALADAGMLEPPGGARVALAGSGVLATAVRELVGARHAVVPVAPDRDVAPDVVVVATDAATPERELAARLTRAGVAHLFVHAVPGGAVVGPFVLPGHSPCLRCCDLLLAGRDRAWPELAAQWEARAVAIDPAAAAWAAGLATAHVSAFLAGGRPQSVGRSWELAGGEVAVRSWRAQPECDCAWLVA